MPEWASTYFKWWGVYTQGDGVGRHRRQGRRRPGIRLLHDAHRHSQRHRLIAASFAPSATSRANHARNLADITVRQNIQLHWLTIESLPEVVDALDAIGLSPKGACGDVVRNVTGCPLAGVAADELIDASPLAVEIAHLLTANPEFYNLPRKFKISATGCPSWCTYPEINDIALTPVKHDGEVGYSLARGRRPLQRTASRRAPRCLRSSRSGSCASCAPITEIFRDQQGLRESRDRARLKYLFMKEGWTAESFLTRTAVAPRLHPASGGAGAGSRRRSSRSRRHSSASGSRA